MGVYKVNVDPGADFGRRAYPFDGDRNKVIPSGIDFHPVTHSAKLEDGTRVKMSPQCQGVPVDPTHLPKKIKIGGGKRLPADVIMHNGLVVSEKFREVVEVLEPGLHQFVPTELVWKDGTHVAIYYWFYPCSRVDCLDRVHSTMNYREQYGTWAHVPGGKYVANLEQVGAHHVWIDPRLDTYGLPFVSEAFKQAMADAGVRGLAYYTFPTV